MRTSTAKLCPLRDNTSNDLQPTEKLTEIMPQTISDMQRFDIEWDVMKGRVIEEEEDL